MKFTLVPHSLIVIALVVVLPSPVFAQIDPRILGTWKLNLAKSIWEPGPPPTSLTVTREQVGDAVKYTIEIVAANGNRKTIVETPKYDGKDYARTGIAATDPDTVALKRLDTNTVEETLKKAGKVFQTARQVVSKDGKVITTTLIGTNVSGQRVRHMLVYDKQSPEFN
jgi:hypothetical protein